MKNKKAIVQSETALWILAIIVLAVVVLIFFFLRGRGTDILQKIFDMLRFGR